MDGPGNALRLEGPFVEAHDELDAVATCEFLADLLTLDRTNGNVRQDRAGKWIRHGFTFAPACTSASGTLASMGPGTELPFKVLAARGGRAARRWNLRRPPTPPA